MRRASASRRNIRDVSASKWSAKSASKKVRWGILNATGEFWPVTKASLTMRAAIADRGAHDGAQFERRLTSRTAPRAALVVRAA